MGLAFLFLSLSSVVTHAAPKHILMIVADDLGYNDLGIRNSHGTNGPRTITPTIDSLVSTGLTLSSYYTFKICSPSRASSLTGRYPWGAGFYDMSQDNDHTTTNFTLYPQLLHDAGYQTHALGKWDIGFMLRNASATYRGFDSFYGYYMACNADYWYHTAPGGICGYEVHTTDWSDNLNNTVGPADLNAINGTYNRDILSARAVDIVKAHNQSEPFYMYLAFQVKYKAFARRSSLTVFVVPQACSFLFALSPI
jgi:arylsulfatase B